MAELLGVDAPWKVMDVQRSSGTQTVTVHIERPPPHPGLFSRRAVVPVRRQLRWEHVTLAGWRCRVQVGLRDGDALPATAWTGEEAPGYTRGLQRLIMDLLLAGATTEQLSVLLKLPFADLWRHKFRLDQGRNTTALPAPSGLPAEGSPLWPALLMGRVSLDVKALGLRLLLAKLQREAALHGDADLHRQAAQELHRYFLRSQAVLRHEIAQLPGLTAQVPAAMERAVAAPVARAAAVSAAGMRSSAAQGFELPDATDPLWLALLEGECSLDVRALGLRLLLTQLRSQIRVIEDSDVRMLKLVEIHRYFSRHQGALGYEISQLRNWRAH
ncbi:hypothetical protein GCM10009107_63130 [Ideonella azotifigens]|uniref:Uncharacterized protein n=4 Tax=Ideonella azotifigens TaxID=513160 RepID=A0ABN1KM34_9BURK